MGIKGRRVHMIEELSETIISFQRGKTKILLNLMTDYKSKFIIGITGFSHFNIFQSTNASPHTHLLACLIKCFAVQFCFSLIGSYKRTYLYIIILFIHK